GGGGGGGGGWGGGGVGGPGWSHTTDRRSGVFPRWKDARLEQRRRARGPALGPGVREAALHPPGWIRRSGESRIFSGRRAAGRRQLRYEPSRVEHTNRGLAAND